MKKRQPLNSVKNFTFKVADFFGLNDESPENNDQKKNF